MFGWRRKAKTDTVDTYAVVQDLMPFGYRVVSKHSTLREAEAAADYSIYLSAMPLDHVERANDRLRSADAVMDEIRKRA